MVASIPAVAVVMRVRPAVGRVNINCGNEGRDSQIPSSASLPGNGELTHYSSMLRAPYIYPRPQ